MDVSIATDNAGNHSISMVSENNPITDNSTNGDKYFFTITIKYTKK